MPVIKAKDLKPGDQFDVLNGDARVVTVERNAFNGSIISFVFEDTGDAGQLIVRGDTELVYGRYGARL